MKSMNKSLSEGRSNELKKIIDSKTKSINKFLSEEKTVHQWKLKETVSPCIVL